MDYTVTWGCHLKLRSQISCHETILQYKVRKMCQISYCHGQNAGYHTSHPHICHHWKNCNSNGNNHAICKSKPFKTTLVTKHKLPWPLSFLVLWKYSLDSIYTPFLVAGNCHWHYPFITLVSDGSYMENDWVMQVSLLNLRFFDGVLCENMVEKIFLVTFFFRNTSEWKWQYSEPRKPVSLRTLKDFHTQ